MSDRQAINDAIAEYARAYARLEALQHPSGDLPRGDQKTGCIGEFYARLYIERSQPGATIAAGGHSNKAWDFRVLSDTAKLLIQVKAVSAYSSTRVLSPIHAGWDWLWVVSLDVNFNPDGFWVVEKDRVAELHFPVKGVRVPLPGGAAKTSRGIAFGPNRIVEFQT